MGIGGGRGEKLLDSIAEYAIIVYRTGLNGFEWRIKSF